MNYKSYSLIACSVLFLIGGVGCNTNVNKNTLNSGANGNTEKAPEATQQLESPTPSDKKLLPTSKTNSSLMMILDASGSMEKPFGGKSRIETAKQAVQEIIGKLPQTRDFGLMVYGNGQSSCKSLTTLANFGSKNRSDVIGKLAKVQAQGDTPIAASIQEVARQIRERKEETTIILVSDGEETCGGDPCQVVKQLKAEGYKFTFHGVGVDTNQEADKQLSCLAREGGGVYAKVDPADPSGITRELEKLAISGQFRIKKPDDQSVDGWKIISKGEGSQEPVLLVRKQSNAQLWNTYPLDPGNYEVYLFFKGKKESILAGQMEIKENQTIEFNPGR